MLDRRKGTIESFCSYKCLLTFSFSLNAWQKILFRPSKHCQQFQEVGQVLLPPRGNFMGNPGGADKGWAGRDSGMAHFPLAGDDWTFQWVLLKCSHLCWCLSTISTEQLLILTALIFYVNLWWLLSIPQKSSKNAQLDKKTLMEQPQESHPQGPAFPLIINNLYPFIGASAYPREPGCVPDKIRRYFSYGALHSWKCCWCFPLGFPIRSCRADGIHPSILSLSALLNFYLIHEVLCF